MWREINAMLLFTNDYWLHRRKTPLKNFIELSLNDLNYMQLQKGILENLTVSL